MIYPVFVPQTAVSKFLLETTSHLSDSNQTLPEPSVPGNNPFQSCSVALKGCIANNKRTSQIYEATMTSITVDH